MSKSEAAAAAYAMWSQEGGKREHTVMPSSFMPPDEMAAGS